MLEEGAVVGELEYHVGGLVWGVDLVVQQLDDVGVGEFCVEDYLGFGQLVYLWNYWGEYDFYGDDFAGGFLAGQFYLAVGAESDCYVVVLVSFQELVLSVQHHFGYCREIRII